MRKAAVFISAAEIAKRINASEYAVKKYIRDNKIAPISFAGTKKNRPLYNAVALKKITDNCKRRKTKPEATTSKMITIRVTETEYTHIKKVAEKLSTPVGTLIKKLATGKKITAQRAPTKTVVADPALIRQINWIGNNINQIARSVNEARLKGTISAAFLQQATGMLADIDDQLQIITETLK